MHSLSDAAPTETASTPKNLILLRCWGVKNTRPVEIDSQNSVRINERLEPAQRAVKIVVRDARLAHELVVRLVRLQRLERRAARQCRSALARGRTEREVRGLGQNGEHPDGRELLARAEERAEVAGGDAQCPRAGAAHELVQRALEDGGDTARARELRSPSSQRLTEAAASHATCAVLKSTSARRCWSDGTRYPESFSTYVSSARAGGLGARAPVKRVYDYWAGKASLACAPAVDALQGPVAVRPIPSLPSRRHPTQARHSRARGSPRDKSNRRAQRARGHRPRRARAPHAARARAPANARAVMRGQLASQVGGVPSPACEARLVYRDVRMTGMRPNAFTKPSIRPLGDGCGCCMQPVSHCPPAGAGVPFGTASSFLTD
ncbi:hypothetical protein FB451DRAFT_1195658 [Mycena latifolia]|nr:hypothetical protein FB451DRAFT_1195658 [Mycena latifolia]